MSEIAKVEIFKDKSGGYRWHAVAHNGRIVAESGEAYEHKAHTWNQAARQYPETPIHMIADSAE